MRRIALVTLLAVSACACGRVAGGNNDGAGVFAAACASCHGERGTPPVQMTQQLGVRDLASPEFIARRTRELVIEQVRRGAANGRMPAFSGTLTDVQIQAVADHVMTLGPAR